MFGAAKPFGGSGFGSTASTFGTQTAPFGGTSGGLFGNKTSAPSAFGTPAFGSATPSTGLFGSSSSTGGTNLFGSKPTPASTSFGFGTTSTGGLFGSTTTSSIFQTPQSTSSFPFGGGVSATGTTVKFVPPTSSEQAQKSGISMTIKTQNQCITVMDQYKGKSVEELRMEDYAAGRKTGGTSAFGSSTGTGLFGSQQTSTGGGGGGFGGFGKTGTSGGLFGAKTTSSLFGSTVTATPAFGSGTSSGGLFGKSSTGSGLFGTTATTASTGLFSGSGFNATSSSGSLFGGTFGQNASQSTSLFGQTSKPSVGFGTSTGSGFGTATSGLFGAASSSGGLFGSTANKPSFSFGGTSGGFGSTGFGATTSSGGLFGGTSTGGLFGSKPSVFGTTGFGATSSSAGSLFGGAALGFGNSLSSSTGLGGTSNSLAPGQQQELVQQQVKALANAPFGDSPLFRNLSEPSKTKSTQSSTNSTSKSLNTSQYKVLTRPVARIKPLPVTSPSLGKSRLFQSLEEESDFSPHPLDPPRGIKKLVLKSNNHSEIVSPCVQDVMKLRLRTDLDEDLVAPSPEVVKTKVAVTEDISSNLSNDKSQFVDTISELNLKDHEVTGDADNSNIETEAAQNEELPKCEMKLTRPEYFTIPSIAELDKQVDVNHCQCLVDGFTVGREGYGQVKFLGETNVYGLNLDNIITFRRKEVEVYPDDYTNKPEEGKELNKPAEITLLKVWPTDKMTHTPIKTPQRLKECRFIDHIEEKTMALGAEFIDYQPKEGAWIFKVNHFTTYGFLEEHFYNGLNLVCEDIDINVK